MGEYGKSAILGNDEGSSFTWAAAKKGQSATLKVVGEPTLKRALDFETKEPATFKNGDPMFRVVVPVEYVEGDIWVKDPDDESAGVAHEVGNGYSYSVTQKGKKYPAQRALADFERSLIAARGIGLSVGDVFKVTFTDAKRAPGQTTGKPAKYFKYELLRTEDVDAFDGGDD
ncbi:MAG TPA: hypothetical protein VLT90_13090 [Terriglobales bacterium]|nr:hypothetical protein [Terriglobales bacterium]